MKKALILNAINPGLGGVLVRGEKGTAKSTAVRALAALLPQKEVVRGCRFGCDPADIGSLCPECRERLRGGETLEAALQSVEVVDLPISATEDRVVGALDMEHAIKTGEKRFEAGILAKANRNILYVDEINLLDDHIVDVLLDSAAMGVNSVEREGVSFAHPARFILIGTMDPEEGDLRPQLLDRFGLSVGVTGARDAAARKQIVENRYLYEHDPNEFFRSFEEGTKALQERIRSAAELLARVAYRPSAVERVARICIALGVDGHRADITTLKAARTLAAYSGRDMTEMEDVDEAASLALAHRMRRAPFEEYGGDLSAAIKSI
jgi:Mg-chelatase subunit ChlI